MRGLHRGTSWRKTLAGVTNTAPGWLIFFLWMALVHDGKSQILRLPERATNAPAASELLPELKDLDLARREEVLLGQFLSGNVPGWFRKLCPVTVEEVSNGKTNRATYYVTADYIALGSDEDYFLAPISPATAQKIADRAGCSLPTRKMVDQIYKAAEVKLAPMPIAPGPLMTTVPVFSNHNAMVREARRAEEPRFPLGALTAGHKKDLVITAQLPSHPGKVAIYGWHRTNGVPIQPLYLGHGAGWVDYSQCTRLVQQTMLLDQQSTSVSNVLVSPELAHLLSDEGPLAVPRYANQTGPGPMTNSPDPKRSFTETNQFGERIARFNLEPETRVYLNVPSNLQDGSKLLILFYLLPNGNTIEQTLGKRVTSADDNRFDLQHVLAQTRYLRRIMPRPIGLACLQNTFLSWPSWRKKYGDSGIPRLLDSVQKVFPGNEPELVLTSHSGGGSLVFGYLNAVTKIPGTIVRIAFLDSDYAYDAALAHDKKLATWLNATTNHYLCVLAYDDASALLNGKHFVSASGGTWGRTHTMLADLERQFRFNSRTNAGLEISSAMNGRLEFLMKENPDKKILHTVQVEKNGLIQCLLSGTELEEKGYLYLGPRAYTDFISE